MIQIKDIDFRYPGSKHLVFRDFSLELKENNIYGLLGKNGTGKSRIQFLAYRFSQVYKIIEHRL